MGKKTVRKYFRVFIIMLGCVLVLRIPAMYQHIVDMDESVFSEFGRVILNGGIPYVDVIDNKPPFMYYFFTIIYFLSGSGSLVIVHLVTAIWVALTGLSVYIFSLRIKGETAGIAAAAAFILLMHTYEPKYISTNGETLINLFLVVSSFIFITVKGMSRKSLVMHALSGIMLGAAVLTNYKAGVLAVVYIIHSMIIEPLIYSDNRKDIVRENLFKLSITGISSIIPLAATALKFHADGSLDEALFWGFAYNFGYIESGSSVLSLKMASRMGLFVLMTMPVWFLALKNASSFISRLKEKNESALNISVYFFLFLWLCASVYGAMLGGRGYGHYFIQIVPPLVLTAVMCSGTFIMWRRTLWIWIAVPVLIMTAGRVDIQKSYIFAGEKNAGWASAYSAAAEYIKNHTVQGETIYVWGWATPVYYYSDRRSASRFIISDFVSGRVFGTANDSKAVRSGMTERFMPQLLEDLARNRPAYFLDTSGSGLYGYDRFPPDSFDGLGEYLKKNYVPEAEIGGIRIYARR